MRRRTRSLLIPLLGVGLALATLPLSAGHDLPGTKHPWIELRTANFQFFSNAGRGATRRVALDLEELRAVLAELTDYRLNAPVPTRIYVFRHQRSFAPFRILQDGRPADVAGYFLERPLANSIAVNVDRPRASSIVFHEYVHYLTANSLGELPVWLSEGFAEFYETFEVRGDTAYIGLPILHHLVWLRGTLPIPLADLLEVDHDSPLYNESSRRGDLYAESWILTHYLMLGNPERRLQLGRYLSMVQSGRDFTAAFADAFGDLTDLERELRGYLRGPRSMPFIETTVDIDLDDSIEVREMPPSEVYLRLGELLANMSTDRPERLAYFEAAVAADPGNGAALSALAIEAENRADWEGAEELHRRALAARPDDPLILYRWGEFLAARGRRPSDAIAALERSTRLDPSFGPAWAALTRRYVDAGSSGPQVLGAAETAHRLMPTDTGVSRNLLTLYLRDDRRQQAADLVARSFRTHPELDARAWSSIVHNDLRRARQLLHEGAADSAERRLDLAETDLGRTDDPIIFGSRIETTRRAIAGHRAAVLCREAEQLERSGGRDAARASLDEALALVGDGPLAVSCRRLRDTLDRPSDAVPQTSFRSSPPLVPTREDVDRLNALLADDDLEGALALLRGLRLQAHGASREWVDDWIAEIEETVSYNLFIEQYNRAIDLYNEERYDDAAAVLEELMAVLPEGQQAAMARALLDDTRDAMDN